MSKQLCVIIPAKNEELTIGKCIDSCIHANTMPSDIYVISDGSSDMTYEIALSRGVNALRNESSIGKSLSIKKCSTKFELTENYRFITVLDADTTVDRNYFREIIVRFEDAKMPKRAFSHRVALATLSKIDANNQKALFFKKYFLSWLEQGIAWIPLAIMAMFFKKLRPVANSFRPLKNIAVVCGYVYSVPNNGITALRALEYMLGQAIYKKAQDEMGVICVAPGCTSVWSSDVFKQLDFDNDTLVEDMVWTISCHVYGLGRICHAPKAIVYTQDPNTIMGYIKQSHRWHFGLWQVMIKFGLPFRFEKIDLELILIVAESLFFSFLYVFIIPLSYFFPEIFIYALITDQLYMIALVLYFGFTKKRWDIIYYCPIFVFLKYLNAMVFVYTFIKAVILKKNHLKWYSPTRY